LLVKLGKDGISGILAEINKGGVIELNEFLSGNGGKEGEGGGEFHFLVILDFCFNLLNLSKIFVKNNCRPL
jgi:hypothetical protein